MTYVKTHWINNEEPSIDADNLNHMEQGIEDAQYPDGGNAGQLLAKTTNGTEWVDAPNSAVWGLIQGQLNEQEDLYAELESKIVAPTGGTTGQYLRKTAGGTEWADAGSIDTVNNISPDANKNVQTVVELTQAQYNALANPDPNVTYLITDGINNPANNTINSRGVSYDNTDSGLTATTVQDAIDENATAIDELNNGLANINYRKQKAGNTLTAEFVAMGAQIDANRVFAMVGLPFVVADATYSVVINSCTILGVSSVTPSTVSIDNKTSVGIRFSIPHSGTIRDAFAVVLNLTITY